MNKHCVAMVTNKKYLTKTLHTLKQLRNVGEYNDDVVIFIGDDLKNSMYKYVLNLENVYIKYFPTQDRKDIIKILERVIVGDGRNIKKKFQWHKNYLFSTFFKGGEKFSFLTVECVYINQSLVF